MIKKAQALLQYDIFPVKEAGDAGQKGMGGGR